MKNILGFAAVLITACVGDQLGIAADPPAPSAPAPNADPAAQVTAANNSFALGIYAQIQGTDGNLFFSPISLSTALAMTADGAKNDTAAEMYSTLGSSKDRPLDADAFNKGVGAVMTHLNEGGKDRPFDLSIANAIWGQQGYDFQDKFLGDLKTFYQASLTPLDFVKAPDDSRKTINDWVAQETNKKITDLMPEGSITSMTRMVLTNAVYFKGKWETPFRPEMTANAPFHLAGQKTVDAPMMKADARECQYGEDDSMQVLELPYEYLTSKDAPNADKGAPASARLSMIIILPKAADGLPDLEKGLTTDRYAAILAKLQSTPRVNLTIPKFKLTAQFELSAILQQMGMKLAFTDKADFSGIATKEGLSISAVVHKAYVDVNEEGTEAAGATGVAILAMAMPVDPPKSFTADHPFVFVIHDVDTGAILFMGRVTNPAQ